MVDGTDGTAPSAFLITPFSPEAAGGEDPDIYENVQSAIEQAAAEAEVALTTAADIFAAGVIIDQVRGAIERAAVVVAICTGRNANVFYELGLAEVLGHTPVLVAATTRDLPFDVAHWRAQMYESEPIDTLAERVRRAIKETLAERTSMPLSVPEVIVREPEPPAATGSAQLKAVRSDDEVTFAEGAKARILHLAEEHRETATRNWETQPNVEMIPELASLRFPLVDDLLAWLAPAIEYRSDWLVGPLRLLSGWFQKEITVEGLSGFATWKALHQSWTVLSLRGIVAAAGCLGAWPSLVPTFSLPSPDTRDEDSPLLCHPEFIFAKGYGGNSQIEFDDFVAFGEASSTLAGSNPLGRDPIESICGADLILGLARCVWEAGQGYEAEQGRANAYAGFAAYYPHRYGWMARAVENEAVIAEALGAPGPARMREIGREWFPALARRHMKTMIPGRGESWEGLLHS